MNISCNKDSWVIKDNESKEILRGDVSYFKQVRKAINLVIEADKMSQKIKAMVPKDYFKDKEI